jgi:hypothetical protein
MFGSVFNQRALSLISGWFCAMLVITLLTQPVGLSAEERRWQSDDLTYSSPIAVPDLLATLDQNQRLDRVPVVTLLADPLPRANLTPPEESTVRPVWTHLAVIPSAAFPPAPFLPRPPPAHLHLRTA